MTFIAIHCPKCRKRFRAKLQHDSRTEICPNCQTTIVIPSSKDAQTQSVDAPQVLEQPVVKSFPDAPPVPTTNYGNFGQQPSGKRVRSSAYAGHETKRKFLATGLWLQFVGLSIATIGFPLFVGAVALADLANRNGDAVQKALGLVYVGGILLFGIGVFVSLAIPVARNCTIWVSVTVVTAIVSVFMINFGIAIATNDSVVASALIAVGGLAALLVIEFYIRFLVAVGKWLKIDRMIEAASDLSLQFWVSIAIVGVLVLPLLLASNLYVAVWIKERLEWNVTSGSSAALLLNLIALGGLAGVVAVVVRMLLKYLRLVSDLSWYLVYGGDSYESLKKI